MNSKLGKTFVTGVMVLLITVCFIPAMAGAFTAGDGKHDKGFDRKDRHRPALGIWRDPQMVEKLELTAEQVKQVRNKGKLKRSAIENVSEIERHDADR